MTRSVLLLLTVGAFAQQRDPNFAAGIQCFQQSRYEEALQYFEQAARAQPANGSIENAIGLADTKLHRLEEANRHYANAIRLNPKSADPHRNLAVNELAAHDFDAAQKQLSLALAIEPEDPFSHYYLALVFLATGDDGHAAAQAEPARSLFLNDPDAAWRMANACIRTGHTEQGLGLIDSLEKQSTLTAAQEFDIASLLNSQHLYTQTVSHLRRVLELNPGVWANRYNLADALLEAGQTTEALSILESLAAEHSHEAPVLSLLGSAYESSGKPDRALECYRKAVAADPENHDYYLDYARVLADLNGYDDSEKFIETSLRQFGNDYALTIRLGALEMMQGKLEEARQTFRKAIATDPNLALGHVALAQTYLREHRDDDAAKELADSRARLAPDANLDHYYGLSLVRLERYEQALAPLEQAARLNPADPETFYLLGKANAALNRFAAARAHFEHAIQLDPQNASAHYQLSRIYTQLGDTDKGRQMAELTRQLIQSQREAGLKAQRARRGTLEPLK